MEITELISFYHIRIQRAIMHEIRPKQNGQEHGSAIYESRIMTLNQKAEQILKERLVDAAGHHSKAFEMEISQYQAGNFFGLCRSIQGTSDEQFIETSKQIAGLLATTQNSKKIPGGYFIFLECKFPGDNDKVIYIAIKAEPHQALRKDSFNIRALDDIFLSPSQKLYKIGIIYERETMLADKEFPNNQYGAILMDQQFSPMGNYPAVYFSKNFLGFTADRNAKIQSKKFYEMTSDFIKENIKDFELQMNLLSVLNTTFTVNQEPVITLSEFAETNFEDDDIQDEFLNKVGSQLPDTFLKDSTLFKRNLKKKKINFPDNINVIGPDDVFMEKVTFIRDQEDLDSLELSNDFTIVKIQGKPYQS